MNLNSSIRNGEKFLENAFDFIEIPMVRLSIIIAIIVYILMVIPKLSMDLTTFMKHVLTMWFVKLLIIVGVYIIGKKDPVLAIFIVLALVFSVLHFNRLALKENMDVDISQTLKNLINQINKVNVPEKKQNDHSMAMSDMDLNKMGEHMSNNDSNSDHKDLHSKINDLSSKVMGLKKTMDENKTKDMNSMKDMHKDMKDMHNKKDMNGKKDMDVKQNNLKIKTKDMKESFESSRKGCPKPKGFNSGFGDCITNTVNQDACKPCGQVMALNGESGAGEMGPQGLISTIGYPGHEYASF